MLSDKWFYSNQEPPDRKITLSTLLIKNTTVLVTMDDQRREISDGGLFIRDGRIGSAGVMHDPAAAAVFFSPMHVFYTVAAGKLVVKEEHFVTLDLPKLIKDHKFTSRKLMENEQHSHNFPLNRFNKGFPCLHNQYQA